MKISLTCLLTGEPTLGVRAKRYPVLTEEHKTLVKPEAVIPPSPALSSSSGLPGNTTDACPVALPEAGRPRPEVTPPPKAKKKAKPSDYALYCGRGGSFRTGTSPYECVQRPLTDPAWSHDFFRSSPHLQCFVNLEPVYSSETPDGDPLRENLSGVVI